MRGLAAGLSVVVACCGPSSARTPLGNVRVVTDVDTRHDADDPGDQGGGMSSALFFQSILRDEVHDCGRAVADIAVRWGAAHQLPITEQSVRPAHAQVLAYSEPDRGWIEVTYRFRDTGARVTVYFVDRRGRRVEPAGINDLIERFALDRLMTALTGGILCARS